MPEIHPDIHAAIDAEFARAYAKHAAAAEITGANQ